MGLATFAAAAVVYGTALTAGGERQARAMGFITLVVTNLLLIAANRSQTEGLVAIMARPNRVFWSIAILAVAGLAVAAYLPGAAALFQFEPPSPLGAAASVFAAVVAVIGIEAAKSFQRRRSPLS